MLTTLLRVSALIGVISTVGAESARRATENDSGQAWPSTPWSFSINGPAIVDISSIATAAPDSLLGVEVAAEDVCVSELGSNGFWATADGDDARAFVHPAEGPLIEVRVGESVAVHGEVRLTTDATDRRQVPYVYAYTVRPAWPHANHPGTRSRGHMCVSPRNDVTTRHR